MATEEDQEAIREVLAEVEVLADLAAEVEGIQMTEAIPEVEAGRGVQVETVDET